MVCQVKNEHFSNFFIPYNMQKPNRTLLIGRWLLDEIKADKEWDKLFAESEDILEHLAQEALMEHEKGKTKNLDINKL
ncbi:hypothetical protein BuS5_00708 [Desulfosarcina sp. BuS5]|nr:hypothetical protein BuS5_00708 [Desulfosarcina sp. BuS5]